MSSPETTNCPYCGSPPLVPGKAVWTCMTFFSKVGRGVFFRAKPCREKEESMRHGG